MLDIFSGVIDTVVNKENKILFFFPSRHMYDGCWSPQGTDQKEKMAHLPTTANSEIASFAVADSVSPS